MDQGRRWALETFGTYGPEVRKQIAGFVRAEHEGSLDSQDASNHRSTRHYGLFWSGIIEKFETLGEAYGGALVRPANAPYKVPVINGVALFPWRYARNRDVELEVTRFGTSDARVAMTDLRTPPTQGVFDFALPDPGLTEEERQLLTALQGVTDDPAVTSGRLVLVLIASSVSGLFEVQWGQVEMDSEGFVKWAGFHESLLPLISTSPVSTSPTGTFTAGEPPSKFPQEERTTSNDG